MLNVITLIIIIFIFLVLLALRSSQTLPEDPMAAMKDYFGSFKSAEWDEVSNLEEGINKLGEENVLLLQQIEDLKAEKIELLEKKKQRELEEQQRLAEEEAKKTKKGGKK